MTEHTDFESSPDAYQVKLDAFEGPLDLLLHLIRKNELNIYDIPISLITEQYLGYLTLLAAAEVRATLMRGFTTVRDLGGPSFALKRAIASPYGSSKATCGSNRGLRCSGNAAGACDARNGEPSS